MIISKDELGQIFDDIHNVWIQTRTSVIILSAADCDSICTTKILTSLLTTEMIAYQIYPVLSYEDIANYNDNVLQERIADGELHTVIMINCGAIVDLNQLLFIRPIIQRYQQQNTQNNNDDDLDQYIDDNMPEIDGNFKIYVIDSHRPFNLMNVYDQEKICLLQGDDEQKMEEFPTLIDSEDENDEENINPNVDYNNNNNNNNDDDDDDDFDIDIDDDDDFDIDDEDDFDDNINNNNNEPLRKRRKLNHNQSVSSSSSNNSKPTIISSSQRRLIRIQREQDEYYKYQYYALNSSGIMYLMARSVQKDDNNMLWNAILGLTESFIYEKIDRDKYNSSVSIYCDEVKRRNETYNDISTMDNEVRYNLNEENIDNSRIVGHRLSDHIQFSTEFRFILMRFWTLYDSMYYSRYVSTKLGVWKQRGKDNLKYLLAKMALPLNEAQQPYNSMKRQYKRKLPQLFMDNLNEGLDDNLTFGSFTKQHGAHQSISASDMVYAITAVLESDFRVKKSKEDINGDNDEKMDADNNDNNDDNNNNNNDNLALFFDDNAWKSNFFYGYDAISKEKQYLLKNAINLAKKRQREIIDFGIKLIEKRDIKTMGVMRYCKIENSNNFQSPMLLCKLGLFIMDAFRAQTTKNAKHFVLASFNDKSNSYTVVGIPAKRYIGDVNKSPFYNAFEESRKRVKANAKIVFFEGHVIQIHKDDFTEWLENLHERLLSYAF